MKFVQVAKSAVSQSVTKAFAERFQMLHGVVNYFYRWFAGQKGLTKIPPEKGNMLFLNDGNPSKGKLFLHIADWQMQPKTAVPSVKNDGFEKCRRAVAGFSLRASRDGFGSA